MDTLENATFPDFEQAVVVQTTSVDQNANTF